MLNTELDLGWRYKKGWGGNLRLQQAALDAQPVVIKPCHEPCLSFARFAFFYFLASTLLGQPAIFTEEEGATNDCRAMFRVWVLRLPIRGKDLVDICPVSGREFHCLSDGRVMTENRF